MTKNELIAAIAAKTGKPKAAIAEILAATTEIATETLRTGEEVVLGDLAKLKVAERAARTGTNPSNGAKVDIPAKRVVKFKASKSLSDAIA